MAAQDAVVVPALRTVVVASADGEVRERVGKSLVAVRWQVFEAHGAAAAMALLEELRPEALLVDAWLPDLEVGEFAEYVRAIHPETELLRIDGLGPNSGRRSPRRHELLEALRDACAPASVPAGNFFLTEGGGRVAEGSLPQSIAPTAGLFEHVRDPEPVVTAAGFLPEMIGTSEAMRELAKLVRLVAPRSTTVLIEGETGTGKELVAKALHRLSPRANKPLVVLNCAAIPEALLEAELFGHTRGAFTGAVRSRTGRIEAADGGTLFLDEIGEMPLALQSKMLRFLECGELQRVGDNEPTYVDVRIIAATHQPLEQRAEEQAFRLDLYHRLAVFPIEVPTLRSRAEDIRALADHFLGMFGHSTSTKRLSQAAEACLKEHHWPGNVRELMHVLERAMILAVANTEIGTPEIRIRKRDRSS